jgi:hypothetical protein
MRLLGWLVIELIGVAARAIADGLQILSSCRLVNSERMVFLIPKISMIRVSFPKNVLAAPRVIVANTSIVTLPPSAFPYLC